MDLDELKSIWERTTQKGVEGYFVSHEELQRLIRQRSNSAVSKIKRGIRNKVLMAGGVGLLLIAFSVMAFNSEEPLFNFLESFSNSESNFDVAVFYLVFGIVISFISLFNFISYRKIQDIEKYDLDLRNSIQRVLQIIQRAIRVKIYSDMSVVPLTALIIVFIHIAGDSPMNLTVQTVSLIILGAAGFAVLSYYLTKWGQKRRYGDQIEILKTCLMELDENS